MLMLSRNPIQFAVVREDPRIEQSLLEGFESLGPGAQVLLIGSGGCTAFHLQSVLPGVRITLVDPNPAQIELIRKKSELLAQGNPDAVLALIESGNFEALFRRFREFLWEFVARRDAWVQLFRETGSTSEKHLNGIFSHPYWHPAFELHFHDSLLGAMFGPQATQHAPKGSYPQHFESALRQGLLRPDRGQNYFLHHLFLGEYLPEARPAYLATPRERFKPLGTLEALGTLTTHCCMLAELTDFSSYDLIGASNVFDWMNEDEIGETARRIVASAKPGAVLLGRQLNHSKDFKSAFGPAFRFDEKLERELHARDRSLFYSSLMIGVRE